MTDLLRRFAPLTLELRDSGTTAPVMEGYASTFNQPYDIGGVFKEEVMPGAFTRSLASGPDVRFLVDHEGAPLARTRSGTLRLAEDSTGLHVRAELDPANPSAQSLISAVSRGDLDAMSFAFRVAKGGDTWNEDWTHRSLVALNIHDGDVSAVTYPANPSTSIALRAADERAARVERACLIAEWSVAEMRAGRTLSAANLDRLNAALSALTALGDAHLEAVGHVQAVVQTAATSVDPADPDDVPQLNSATSGLHPSVARARLAALDL